MTKLVLVHLAASLFDEESSFTKTQVKYISNIIKAVRYSVSNSYPYGTHTNWYSKVDLDVITEILGGSFTEERTMWPVKVSPVKLKKVWELINSTD